MFRLGFKSVRAHFFPFLVQIREVTGSSPVRAHIQHSDSETRVFFVNNGLVISNLTQIEDC
jgi:hypothetical protein